jgi:hypothetical protein
MGDTTKDGFTVAWVRSAYALLKRSTENGTEWTV